MIHNTNLKIYVSHSKDFDFKTELYAVLRNSNLSQEFIFPHETSEEPFSSKELFKNKGCDLVLAEVSFPSTGQGIELGWADVFGIPIVCFYKSGTVPSKSLNTVTGKIIEYGDGSDLGSKLTIGLGLNIA